MRSILIAISLLVAAPAFAQWTNIVNIAFMPGRSDMRYAPDNLMVAPAQADSMSVLIRNDCSRTDYEELYVRSRNVWLREFTDYQETNRVNTADGQWVYFSVASSLPITFVGFRVQNDGPMTCHTEVWRHTAQVLPPPNPLSFSAAPDKTTIRLTWQSGGGSTTGYQFVMDEGSVPPASCYNGAQTVFTADSTYLMADLRSDTNYSFRLCAEDSRGQMSSGVTLTTRTLKDIPPTTNPTMQQCERVAAAIKDNYPTLIEQAVALATATPERMCVAYFRFYNLTGYQSFVADRNRLGESPDFDILMPDNVKVELDYGIIGN